MRRQGLEAATTAGANVIDEKQAGRSDDDDDLDVCFRYGGFRICFRNCQCKITFLYDIWS